MYITKTNKKRDIQEPLEKRTNRHAETVLTTPIGQSVCPAVFPELRDGVAKRTVKVTALETASLACAYWISE